MPSDELRDLTEAINGFAEQEQMRRLDEDDEDTPDTEAALRAIRRGAGLADRGE